MVGSKMINKSIPQLQSDFHNARVVGEKKLADNELTFEQFESEMLYHEAQLRARGVYF